MLIQIFMYTVLITMRITSRGKVKRENNFQLVKKSPLYHSGVGYKINIVFRLPLKLGRKREEEELYELPAPIYLREGWTSKRETDGCD